MGGASPGEEVGSGCKQREGCDDEQLLMGGSRMEEGKERSRKTVESGEAGGVDMKFVIDSDGA